jgi:hypothetical protein
MAYLLCEPWEVESTIFLAQAIRSRASINEHLVSLALGVFPDWPLPASECNDHVERRR